MENKDREDGAGWPPTAASIQRQWTASPPRVREALSIGLGTTVNHRHFDSAEGTVPVEGLAKAGWQGLWNRCREGNWSSRTRSGSLANGSHRRADEILGGAPGMSTLARSFLDHPSAQKCSGWTAVTNQISCTMPPAPARRRPRY